MNLIHQTGAEMAMTDKIFTTRDREQTKKDAVEVWTPEDAFCGIIYPKFPIGPWNKIYKAYSSFRRCWRQMVWQQEKTISLKDGMMPRKMQLSFRLKKMNKVPSRLKSVQLDITSTWSYNTSKWT